MTDKLNYWSRLIQRNNSAVWLLLSLIAMSVISDVAGRRHGRDTDNHLHAKNSVHKHNRNGQNGIPTCDPGEYLGNYERETGKDLDEAREGEPNGGIEREDDSNDVIVTGVEGGQNVSDTLQQMTDGGAAITGGQHTILLMALISLFAFGAANWI